MTKEWLLLELHELFCKNSNETYSTLYCDITDHAYQHSQIIIRNDKEH
jgi:hypothetical protein